jgi:curved DNA-binding protein
MIKVTVAPSQEYERKGTDLYKTIQVPLKAALFGDKIQVKTPEKEVTLKIPKDTRNGQKFRLRGQGFPDRKSGIRGDLYLVADILLPKSDTLPETLRQLCEEQLPD